MICIFHDKTVSLRVVLSESCEACKLIIVHGKGWGHPEVCSPWVRSVSDWELSSSGWNLKCSLLSGTRPFTEEPLPAPGGKHQQCVAVLQHSLPASSTFARNSPRKIHISHSWLHFLLIPKPSSNPRLRTSMSHTQQITSNGKTSKAAVQERSWGAQWNWGLKTKGLGRGQDGWQGEENSWKLMCQLTWHMQTCTRNTGEGEGWRPRLPSGLHMHTIASTQLHSHMGTPTYPHTQRKTKPITNTHDKTFNSSLKVQYPIVRTLTTKVTHIQSHATSRNKSSSWCV